jgi:hypothetical protein
VLALGALSLLYCAKRGADRPPRGSDIERAEVAEVVALAPAPPVAAERAAIAGAVPAPPPGPSAAELRKRMEGLAGLHRPRPEPPPPEPDRWLTGRVLLPDGSPGRGELLNHVAHRDGMRPAGAGDVALGPYGDFRIPILPDWRGVRLQGRGRDHAELDRWIELDPQPGVQDVGILVLSAGGSIAGEVRLDGRDPQGWSVLVMTSDPELPALLPRRSSRTAQLDALGRFELRHVPAGPAEVTLSHPLLGVVDERALDVREGRSMPVVLAYDGPDPARALLVTVDASRPPRPDEIWVEDESAGRREPRSITGWNVRFEELRTDVAYTLVLAREEEERPTRVDGVRAGTRTRIAAHSQVLRQEVQAQAVFPEIREALSAEDQFQRGLREIEVLRERLRASSRRTDGRR